MTFFRPLSKLAIIAGAVATASLAFAATSAKEAQQLEARRSKGLADAVKAHVLKNEPLACEEGEVPEMSLTRFAAGGTIDYVGVQLDPTKSDPGPRTYFESYVAIFLVVQSCTYGSTKSGSWVEPKKLTYWRIETVQPADAKGRLHGKRTVSIERYQDGTVPSLDLAPRLGRKEKPD